MALLLDLLLSALAALAAGAVLALAWRLFAPKAAKAWLKGFVARHIVAEEPLLDDDAQQQKDARRQGAKREGRGILLTLRLGAPRQEAEDAEAGSETQAPPRPSSRRERGGGGNRGGRY